MDVKFTSVIEVDFFYFKGGISMKRIVANALSNEIEVLTVDEILQLIEQPKFQEQGDLSFPCFHLSKHLKKNPKMIAQELKDTFAVLIDDYFAKRIEELQQKSSHGGLTTVETQELLLLLSESKASRN